MYSFGLNKDGFKKKTFNEILLSLETRAKELYGENVNLSERSPLGMFLKSIAWELNNTWQSIENSHFNGSALTASGNPLDDIVHNFGRERFGSLVSIGEVKFEGRENTLIPKGFIISVPNKAMFRTVDKGIIENGVAFIKVESLETGEDKNVPANTITKINNPIAGLRTVINPEATSDGVDIESDNSLRIRHLEALREPATGDNEVQYKLWAREVEGVGNIRVQSTTPKPGYVTVIITDVNNSFASENLKKTVYDHIAKVKPVNAGLVIESADTKVIDIECGIDIIDGFTTEDIKNRFKINLKDYYKTVGLEGNYVSYAQIGKLLLGIEGVLDYKDLKLNNLVSNIALTDVEVPSVGIISLRELD